MPKRSIALLWAMALAGQAAAGLAPVAPTEALAVVYDENEDWGSGNVSRIIAGIETVPNVVIYRIGPKDGGTTLLADATPRAPRTVHLAYNGQGPIAVVYPNIGEPYRSVFSRIIEGIEEKAGTRVAGFAIGAGQSPQELAAELRRRNIRLVIALGRNGLKATENLDHDIGVVVGGVLSVPESELHGQPIFSLAPDPNLLFERLRALMPGARRVFVVYDPRQNSWLIRIAREAAKRFGLELVPQEAADLKTALRYYQEDIATADPSKDAVWLPQDSVTVDESAVLPLVLQGAWNRSIAVFSSSVSHVRRGALFSLYPNNVELGRNLAESALGRSDQSAVATPGIVPLREVLVAVNIRTASHLGLGISYRQQQSFDMVFPEQ